jgi:putative phosphoesterase
MKLAILSDIHGNYSAFMEVITVCKKYNIEKLLLLGDQVGYYYESEKIYNELMSWNYLAIRGNHEEILLDYINRDNNFRNGIDKKYGSSIKQLIGNKKIIEITQNLPSINSIRIDNINILMCHGSRTDAGKYLYPTEKKEILEAELDEQYDFIFIGHSHYPFIYSNGKSTLINVGSVGQNRVAGGVANWGILDTSNCVFSPMSTPYDTFQLIEMAKQNDSEIEYLQKILKRK